MLEIYEDKGQLQTLSCVKVLWYETFDKKNLYIFASTGKDPEADNLENEL